MVDSGLKQTIINEYLVGSFSYRQLGKKYGISYNTIHRWILAHQQQQLEQGQAIAQAAILQTMKEDAKATDQPLISNPAEQIKELQKQLAQERLHNKLLTAMIDVAEEELKIPIRKKYGTRQFKK